MYFSLEIYDLEGQKSGSTSIYVDNYGEKWITDVFLMMQDCPFLAIPGLNRAVLSQ